MSRDTSNPELIEELQKRNQEIEPALKAELELQFDHWFNTCLKMGYLRSTQIQEVTCKGVILTNRCDGFWALEVDPTQALPGFWSWKGGWIYVYINGKTKETVYRKRQPDANCKVFEGLDNQRRYNRQIAVRELAKLRR
jgi:lipopolysaccharide assembly outer membrane protein LptD (OstA)